MQLSWVANAQFAGYMMAKEQGFYEDANLDVDLLYGGPNVNNVQQLTSGQADLTVDRVSTLFLSRDKGIPIKGIAEFDQKSGFWLVAKKSSGINSPDDLVGQKVGIFADDEFQADALLTAMGVDPSDVKTFYQGFTMDPWLNDEYPVAEMTSFGQLQEVYHAGYTDKDLVFFKPSDYDVGILHGCLIANESAIQSSPDALTAFVEATMKGWTYAFAHPDEAVDAILAEEPSASRPVETSALDAMKDVLWDGDTPPDNWGQIPMDNYEETAKILEDGDYVDHPIDVEKSVDLTIAP